MLRPSTLITAALLVGALVPMSLLTTGVSFCPFKVATGLPCPGCGMTRATVALLHGDAATSLFFHPLAVPMVAAAVLVGLADAWFWWRSRRSGGRAAPPSWLIERVMASPAPWVAIVALVVVWLVRLPLFLLGTWVY
jgi:hypothetical protein